jgi:hypothetical protein
MFGLGPQNVWACTQNLLAWTQNLLAWTQNLLAWTQNLLAWTQNLLAWTQNVLASRLADACSGADGWLRASARYPESLGVTSFPFVGGDGFR